MTTQRLAFVLCFLCILLSGVVVGSLSKASLPQHDNNPFGLRPKTLFVFGDSYVDTGNIPKNISLLWKFPYGITFPGKPTGRASDGRVSTDYLAKYLHLRSPVPYSQRRYAPPRDLKHGMNFAFGGSGVFETVEQVPNTTVQIDYFRQVVGENVYGKEDLHSSVALVSVVGNDYTTFASRNDSNEDFKTFARKVVKQLIWDMKRIHRLGVRKVAVATMLPIGCYPAAAAANGFRQCNETYNVVADVHNALLCRALMKLNHAKSDATFILFDTYKAFLTILENKGVQGVSRFPNPLEGCCMGIESRHLCGEVDQRGTKLYRLCEDPKSFFFWDFVHPSQQGWRSIYSLLLPGFRV